MSIELIQLRITSVPIEALRYMESNRFRRRLRPGNGQSRRNRNSSGSSYESRFNYMRGCCDDIPEPRFFEDGDASGERVQLQPQAMRSFYFVKWRALDDPELKVKIGEADEEVQRRNETRVRIVRSLKAKRSEQAGILSQLKSLEEEDEQFDSILNEHQQETEQVDQVAHSAGRGRALCSSEEELDELIASLWFRMKNGMITLTEEREITREIKELEGTRERVAAYAAMRAWVQEAMGRKDGSQDHDKITGVIWEGVRTKQEAIKAKIRYLNEDLEAVESEIKVLQDDLGNVILKRDKAYERIQQYRRQRDEGNSIFYRNRALLNNAKDIAMRKDIKTMEELSHSQVEQFFSLWIGDTNFREDYEKRLTVSLELRQLARDGRRRTPGERTLVPEDPFLPSKREYMVNANSNQTRENGRAVEQGVVSSRRSKWEDMPDHDGDDVVAQRFSALDTEVDHVKLKEMKREEEIAKAKKAMERKQKLAEKNAAKAAKKAQKEAEKKLQERERKERKRAASTTSDEPSEDATEFEKVEENVNSFVRKYNIRRRIRPKGYGSVPKAILKRRKSTSPWVSALFTILFVAMLFLLGYYRYLLLQL